MNEPTDELFSELTHAAEQGDELAAKLLEMYALVEYLGTKCKDFADTLEFLIKRLSTRNDSYIRCEVCLEISEPNSDVPEKHLPGCAVLKAIEFLKFVRN